MRDENESDSEETDQEAAAAFELLAHPTRMAAVRVLWEHDKELRFSEIAERAGISDTGNFNYHFGKLVGHFVRKDGEAYELTRSGRQAITAVLAGDVTRDSTFEPTSIDRPCPFCDAPVELSHDADRLRVTCSSCPGMFQGDWDAIPGKGYPSGTISVFAFPPAGLHDRDPAAVLDAALTRLTSRARDMGNDLCPDCGGPVERWASVCADHEQEGVCESCDSRFAGVFLAQCDTCQNRNGGILVLAALAEPRVRRFFVDHGYDLLDPDWETMLCFLGATEHVHATDPIEYEAVWTVDNEQLAVRFDENASVIECERK